MSLAQIPLGEIYSTATGYFRGAFTILGMLILGVALADIKKYKWDWKFFSVPFFAKFIVWPALILLVIALDTNFFHIYDPLIHKVFLLLSIMPLGTNTVVYATQLNVYPEKIATTVVLSTAFSLLLIPIVTTLFLK